MIVEVNTQFKGQLLQLCFFLFFRIKELHWLKKNTLDKAETFIEQESLVSSFASYSVCAKHCTNIW